MRRALRWIGLGLGSLIVLAFVVAGVLYGVSARKLRATHVVAAERELVIPSDSASIARGAHLVGTRACGQCHGKDFGGKVFADAGRFALLAGPNLTRGRGGQSPPRTDAEWERAIRHGVRRDGTSLVVMPSEFFNGIADDQLAPMIAYLKQVPPVDRDVQPTTLRIVGRLVLGAGRLHMAADASPVTQHVASVDTATSPEYGHYLVSISGCQACHGTSFSGGPGAPDGVPASNLTPAGIGQYTEDDFKTTLRTGVRPGDRGALWDDMPWKFFGTMSDGELHSVWLFLKTLPPKQFGER